MARHFQPLACDRRQFAAASVSDRAPHPGGVFRLGWVQWGERLANGREHVVFPLARRAHFTTSVCLAGSRHGADAWSGVDGGATGATAGRNGECCSPTSDMMRLATDSWEG